MTNEEKELLLKDLCARLPYMVFCNIGLNHPLPLQRLYIDKLNGILLDFYEDGKNYQVYLSEIKPYLRPMSSMTNEEKKEINKLFERESSFLTPYPSWYVLEDNIQPFVDFHFSHHLDLRGLIEKGLALEAPEGMYNFK